MMKNLISLAVLTSVAAASCITIRTGEDGNLLKSYGHINKNHSKYIDLSTDSIVTRSQTVASFSKIKVAAPIEVSIQHSDVQKVEITTNLPAQFINSSVVNGTLNLEYQNLNGRYQNLQTKVVIYTPDFNAIETSSVAKVQIADGFSLENLKINLSSASALEGKLKLKTLDIDASSASKCVLEVNADQIKIDASSASKVIVSGKANKVDADASSASKVMLDQLDCNHINTNTSSVAKITTKS